MTSDERFRRMDAARGRAELTVQDLWLRYVALGGTGDAFDLDGYLQGLVPLEAFQQDVLAQTLNEALDDSYRSYRIPLSTSPPGDAHNDGAGGLGPIIDRLVGDPPCAAGEEDGPPGTGPG